MLHLLERNILTVSFLKVVALKAAILLLDVTVDTALSKSDLQGSVILTCDVDIMFFHDDIGL